MDCLLGLDPGGIGKFGWAIVVDAAEPPLTVVAAGIADHAEAATDLALGTLPPGARLRAAAIDSPMFWCPRGDRRVDQLVREAVRIRGARSPSGTVQNVNSLRGACLIQGIAAAVCIRRLHPLLPVLESHPKALLSLLGISGNEGLAEWLTPGGTSLRKEDERDAAVGVLGAWAMIHGAPGWADLFPHEQDPILPVGAPIGYWMPRMTGDPGKDPERVGT